MSGIGTLADHGTPLRSVQPKRIPFPYRDWQGERGDPRVAFTQERRVWLFLFHVTGDDSEGLAARRSATTRPLIERRDTIARMGPSAWSSAGLLSESSTEVTVQQHLWAGIDIGKSEHHIVVIDTDGRRLLSHRLRNDEHALRETMTTVIGLADGGEVSWAVDVNHGGAALLITLLRTHDQQIFYLPGRAMYHAAASYRGDAKTDARDAAIIADQLRMRRDLTPMPTPDEIAVDLQNLTSHRTDLSYDRTRMINRLRARLSEYFPVLERSLDINASKAALLLLTGYQTAGSIRRIGRFRLETWLRKRGAYKADTIALNAIAAAKSQHVVVAGEDTAAAIVARLACHILAIDIELAALDKQIAARFREHQHAETMLSLPGFGALLGAEFLAALGGDPAAFGTADRLAAAAGLSPVPHDSGRISGNLKRPRNYDRRLMRACFLAAQSSARHHPESKTFYARKRSEGKTHIQAVIALARRRNNVLWAMLRDNTTYQAPSGIAAA